MSDKKDESKKKSKLTNKSNKFEKTEDTTKERDLTVEGKTKSPPFGEKKGVRSHSSRDEGRPEIIEGQKSQLASQSKNEQSQIISGSRPDKNNSKQTFSDGQNDYAVRQQMGADFELQVRRELHEKIQEAVEGSTVLVVNGTRRQVKIEGPVPDDIRMNLHPFKAKMHKYLDTNPINFELSAISSGLESLEDVQQIQLDDLILIYDPDNKTTEINLSDFHMKYTFKLPCFLIAEATAGNYLDRRNCAQFKVYRVCV